MFLNPPPGGLCCWPFWGGRRGIVFVLCGFVVYAAGASCFRVFPCSLSSCFVFPFGVVVASLAGRELVCVLLVRLFVCFVGGWSVYFSCVCLSVLCVLVFVIFLFLLVSAVGCGL